MYINRHFLVQTEALHEYSFYWNPPATG